MTAQRAATQPAGAQHKPLSQFGLSRRSLASEFRAFSAVVKRRWTTFLRYPSWIISLMIWPLIFPVAYIYSARALAGPDNSGLAIFTQNTGITDYVGFIVIGTTIWMWQNIVLWNVGGTLRNEQVLGTLESNWLSPVWRFSILLGNSVTQLTISLIMLVTSAIEFAFILGVDFNGSLWLTTLVTLAAIPSIYGLAFVFASLVIYAKEANAFVFLVRGIVLIFCGITFPVSILPNWMQQVAKWLPQTYIMNAFRTASLGGGDFQSIRGDLLALLGFGAFWLTAGFLTFNWMDRKTRQTGSLSNH